MAAVMRPADCAAGDDALSRGAWGARQAFDAALASRVSAEAFEGLGLAAWWLDLADVVFDSRERAYALYRERDDWASAARVAIWLAWDCWAFRGETAVASGRLQRARRLLDNHPDVPERACSGRAARRSSWRAHEIELARQTSTSWSSPGR